MFSRYILFLSAALLFGLGGTSMALSADSAMEKEGAELTLEAAAALVMSRNPELKALSFEVEAKEGAMLQAGLLPNPELSVEVENFAGSGESSGIDGAETTLGLSQALELGGKRAKRSQAAELDRQLAVQELETRRCELFAELSQSFVDVLLTQQQKELAEEQFDLAEKVYETVALRVETGKVASLEETRARVAVLTARNRLKRAQSDLVASRKSLASLWGSEKADFSQAVGVLDIVGDVPSFEVLAKGLEGNRDTLRLEAEAGLRRAELEVARAEAVPDLNVGLGVRNSQESGDNALVFGISMPLPLFDRNQGNIASARSTVLRAEAMGYSARLRAKTSLQEQYQLLAASHEEVVVLKEEILPSAEKAFEAAEYGYRMGKFGFLEMLDAQRTFFEVRALYLDALKGYHRARIESDRLLGMVAAGSNEKH